jgi:hypothetical protein
MVVCRSKSSAEVLDTAEDQRQQPSYSQDVTRRWFELYRNFSVWSQGYAAGGTSIHLITIRYLSPCSRKPLVPASRILYAHAVTFPATHSFLGQSRHKHSVSSSLACYGYAEEILVEAYRVFSWAESYREVHCFQLAFGRRRDHDSPVQLQRRRRLLHSSLHYLLRLLC